MATIHVFRHAEALHNTIKEFVDSTDPTLTEKGSQQCIEFAAKFSHFPRLGKTTYIVSSPLRRCIDSCILAFAPTLMGAKIILHPGLTGMGSHLSGFGSPVSQLQEEYGEKIDLRFVPDDWADIDPAGRFAYGLEKFGARVSAAKEWLYDLALTVGKGAHIVVMTQGPTAVYLTEDYSSREPPDYKCDWNGYLQYRSYKFDINSKAMIEIPISKLTRGLHSTYEMSEPEKKSFKDDLDDQIRNNTPTVLSRFAAYKKR